MSDFTIQGSPTFYPHSRSNSTFNSPLSNAASVPSYSHTFEDGLALFSGRRSQEMGYEDFEAPAPNIEPNTLAFGEEGGRSGGLLTGGYSGENTTDWTPHVTYWNQGEVYGYGMTGAEDSQETNCGFEGSNQGEYERQSGSGPVEMTASGSYSFTFMGTNTQLALIQSSGATIPAIPFSGSHSNDNDFVRNKRPQERAEILELDYAPSRCQRLGCRSEYVFPNFQSYCSHLKNVHNKHVYCLVPGCSRRTPFNSESDRRRHHKARHDPNATKPFRCERITCSARVKAWTRKDKLGEHNKKYHMRVPCHICSQYFDDFEELSQHTNSDHTFTFGS